MFALESIFGGSRNQPSRKGTRSLHQHCSKTSPKPTSAVNILIWVSERLNLNHYVRLKRDQQYSQKLTNSFLTVFQRNAKGHQSNCLTKKKETNYSVGICQSQPDQVRKPANMKAIGRLSRRSGHIDQIQHGPNDCLLDGDRTKDILDSVEKPVVGGAGLDTSGLTLEGGQNLSFSS